MEQLILWLVFCLAVLALCVFRPHAGRIFLGLFFVMMAIGVNLILVLVAPEQFIALGAASPLVLYRWGFTTVVALAPPLFGLLVATYEITIAFFMLNKGKFVKWGLIGGIVFLIGITPLGIWTLPNPVMALALAYLLTKEYDRTFWDVLRGSIGRRIRRSGDPTPVR